MPHYNEFKSNVSAQSRHGGAVLRLAALVIPCMMALPNVAISAAATDAVFDASAGNGVSNGVTDEFRVVRAGAFIRIYAEGKLLESLALGSFNKLTVNGSSDDDILTVDLSGGDPIPAGGLFFHGKDHHKEGDTLRMAGGSAETISYQFFNKTDGAITVDHSMITYTGLEPIIDLVPTINLIVNGTNSANSITYVQGTTNGAYGKVAIDNFETIEFANKATLTINALFGNDEIVLNNPATPTGLANIIVNASEGNDVVTVVGDTPVNITINGNDGDDLCRVSPSTTSTIIVNGDGNFIGDQLLVSAPRRARLVGTALQITGFMDITVGGIESIDTVTSAKARRLLRKRPAF